MDGENYIAQLTEEERAGLAVEIGKASLHTLSRHRDQTWTPDGVNRRARKIIEARKPEIDVQYAMRSRKHGVEVADGARLSRVYFPTEQSRDEGFRRARHAAMEYSLWVQLYPDGFRWGENKVEIGHCIDMDNSISYGWELDDLIGEGKPLLIYATEADAQRVADILKREGV